MEEIQNENVDSQIDETEDVDSETHDEPTSKDDGEGKDVEAKNRQLFERAKKAEQKAKVEEAEKLLLQKKIKESTAKATGNTLDASDIAKTVLALKDYTPEEVDYIAKQAKFMEVSLPEAAQNEDVNLFLQAKREQTERSDKTPEPSTKQSTSTKDVSQWSNEDLRAATQRGDWEAVDRFRAWMREQR